MKFNDKHWLIRFLRWLPFGLGGKIVDWVWLRSYKDLLYASREACRIGSGDWKQPADAPFKVGKTYKMRGGGWAHIVTAYQDRMAGEVEGGPYFPCKTYWLWCDNGLFSPEGKPGHATDLIHRMT